MDKIMRMHSVTSTIENGFVHIPEKSASLSEYLHELARSRRASMTIGPIQLLRRWLGTNRNP
jgi:hypothetical protein